MTTRCSKFLSHDFNFGVDSELEKELDLSRSFGDYLSGLSEAGLICMNSIRKNFLVCKRMGFSSLIVEHPQYTISLSLFF